jgi:hypothetical protein
MLEVLQLLRIKPNDVTVIITLVVFESITRPCQPHSSIQSSPVRPLTT